VSKKTKSPIAPTLLVADAIARSCEGPGIRVAIPIHGGRVVDPRCLQVVGMVASKVTISVWPSSKTGAEIDTVASPPPLPRGDGRADNRGRRVDRRRARDQLQRGIQTGDRRAVTSNAGAWLAAVCVTASR
jgi:hypothetical protein